METKKIRQAAFGLVFVGGAGLVSASCVENQTSLFVRQVLARPAGACEVTASPDSASYTKGLLDVAFSSEYEAQLLIGSGIAGRGNAAKIRPETSAITVSAIDVLVRDSRPECELARDGSALVDVVAELPAGCELSSFTIPSSGFIDPARGTTPSYGVATAILVDSIAANAIRDRMASDPGPKDVVAAIAVRGQTQGQIDIESGIFEFTITLCNGCLLNFPAEANDPTADVQPNCDLASGIAGAEDALDEPPCRIGQDEAVDCRQCYTTNPSCRPGNE